MNRRESMTALGAPAAGLTALTAGAAYADGQPADHPHHEHFLQCAKACADCQVQCDSCFHHCADLLAAGKKEHAKTLHTCADNAECCRLAATLAALHSPFAKAACECCARCCDECAEACETFKDDTHMAACARACRACARACRDMIRHLSR